MQPMRTRLLILLLFLPFCLQAQDVKLGGKVKLQNSVIDKFVNRYNSSNDHLDSLYIYHPRKRVEVVLTSDVTQTGVKMKNDIDYTSTYTGMDPINVMGKVTLGLEERVYKEVGAYVSWAGINLGYAFEIGKSAEKNTSFYASYMKPNYGIEGKFYHIKQKINGHLTLNSGDGLMGDTEFGSENPAHLKELMIDGYYAFNRKRFAYTAVHGSNDVVQRRSAGSWMVGAKYMWGKVKVDKEDYELLETIGNLQRFSTNQFSIGGGYSYNLVAWHRDAKDKADRGLRNLTFNLTAMPMLTVWNQLNATHLIKEWSDSYELISETEKTDKMKGKMQLNYTAKAGLSFTFDRYNLNLNGHLNHFRYNNKTYETVEREDDCTNVHRTKSKGYFYDWGIAAELHIRF